MLFAILIPIGEVWTAIQVAHHIGWLATIALLVVISACGPSLVHRQGMGVWRRAQRRMEDGEVPGREAIDGVLLLVAGGLLTFPGFITGVLGLLLLLPPVRSVVRIASRAWLVRRVRRSGVTVRVSASELRPNPGDGDGFDRRGRAMTADSYPVEHPRRALDSPDEPDNPTGSASP